MSDNDTLNNLLELLKKGGLFLVGFMIGYRFCKNYAPNVGEVYIFGFRFHHYLVGLAIPFTDDEFIRGFLAGCSLEDLPDIIEDFTPDTEEFKNLSDAIRKEQGKQTKWQ